MKNVHVSLRSDFHYCTLIKQAVILNSSISIHLTVSGLVFGKNNIQNEENVKG